MTSKGKILAGICLHGGFFIVVTKNHFQPVYSLELFSFEHSHVIDTMVILRSSENYDVTFDIAVGQK
jgi:hypothetical protein